MLDRSGKVSLVTGPTAPSDARLRRAQALAHQCGAALEIMRELMRAKLEGQQQLVRSKLSNTIAADIIAKLQESLSTADSLDEVARLEAHAASAYWSAWNELPINFPRRDVARVPEHWRTFGTRKSLITGSPRLATNPPNAILNYCYALLECEARLASTAAGLDPGMGMLHVDAPARDSLACDIMEAVRPSVDAWLLDWIMREPFRRSDFFEERNGNCRLLRTLTAKLSETVSVWGKLVAPWAEYVAHTLWATTSRAGRAPIPTRLTQQHRREAKGGLPAPVAIPKPDRICRGCGKTIRAGRSDCGKCAIGGATKRLVEASRIGRVAAHTPEARAKEGKSQRRHFIARSSWAASSQPSWLTYETYCEKIQPQLAEVSSSAIASTIGVSRWYAGKIRRGHCPHPRHWAALAKLVGIGGAL
jgi:CRISPR-associated endonuclease Cas1